MTDTVPLPPFVTYARRPSWLTATAVGADPTAMFLTICLLAVSTTATVPVVPDNATYARPPSGVTATAEGALLNATVALPFGPMTDIVLSVGLSTNNWLPPTATPVGSCPTATGAVTPTRAGAT